MLRGERVILREYRRDDLPEIRKWINNEAVVRNLGFWMYPQTVVESEEWLERQLTHKGAPQDIQFAIALADDPQETYIGGIGLHGIDLRNRHAELGITIGREDLHGQGLGTEAIQLLLEYSFAFLNLHKINLSYFEYNDRGARCYARCGFREEGRIRENRYYEGRYWDVIRMGITEEEFRRARQAAQGGSRPEQPAP
ncbi:MAG: GNAT family protein [Bacillota bacterium]|nr:GNAT family protein [Bacillota bacterium]